MPDPDEHDDRATQTTPLGEDDTVVTQQNVGKDNMQGGGEYPDPHAPPSETAPGSAGLVESPEPGGGQFAPLNDAVDQDGLNVDNHDERA